MIDGIYHTRRLVQQGDLVDVLDFAGVQHDLLAVADFYALSLQGQHHGRLADVDAERQLVKPGIDQHLLDFLRRTFHQPGRRRHRAAQAQHSGMAVIVGQPRRVNAVMGSGGAEIPKMWIVIAHQQRIARDLVPGPFADHRGGQISDVVVVEAQQRAKFRRGQRFLRPREAIAV